MSPTGWIYYSPSLDVLAELYANDLILSLVADNFWERKPHWFGFDTRDLSVDGWHYIGEV